ncbi:MAG: DUF1553 domain-containing protein [Verrucomicrobiota bacterium]
MSRVFPCLSLPALAGVVSLSTAAAAFAAAPGADSPLSYNRDIRPIISENCFNCHGPDSASRKAGLRLDSFESATTPNSDGVAAIIPGKPDESELVKRLLSKDPDEIMPPAEIHKVMKPEQIAMMRRWVAEGAAYEPHWSFIVPSRSAPPSVGHPEWARNPIDSFILATLDENHLAPAPEADRRTLARRLSLDLTGVPPEPALVEAFVADPDPQAYEKLVDRLMASPAWGQHRARYWMDYARYADTHGIHFDNYREMWPYRQWVIGAFNANMPFDQFTVEQLAGDLLPDRTLDQQIASGFNRCNITTNEGGAIAEEYVVLYARDRTEATSQVWMGLTTGCAVCHDHKFDPIRQKDFYALSAFFNNTTQAAMDGNVANTPPAVTVPLETDRARWDALPGVIGEAQRKIAARREAAKTEFTTWLAATGPDYFQEKPETRNFRLRLPLEEEKGTLLTALTPGVEPEVQVLVDKGIGAEAGPVSGRAYQVTAGSTVALPLKDNFERDKPFSYGAWVKLPRENVNGALFARMEEIDKNYRGWDLWMENGRVGSHIISRWPSDCLKAVTQKPLKINAWQHVFLTYDGSGKAAGLKIYVDGESLPLRIDNDSLKSTLAGTAPFKLGQRRDVSRIDSLALQDVRIYNRQLTADDVSSLSRSPKLAVILAKSADQRSPEETASLYEWYLTSRDEPFTALNRELAALEKEKEDIRQRGSVSLVMQEKDSEAQAYLLARGEYDKRGERLTPATPPALPPMADSLPRNRLGLSRWLLQPDNPLTARVTVNRFWQEIFGAGLVRTAGDFGISGEQPSHPALLDWLAVEFREKGWDMKHLYRLLVTSATYRQQAVMTAEKIAKDPANRLLSRGPRFRMDAEMVRDSALGVSGLLVDKIGGPSVRPYQPDGVWEAVAMPGSDTRDYKADNGANLYRRSLYTFWKRSAPPASMDNFNAPAREACTVRRERTNTPLQALNTLNDIQFVEAARVLAEHTLKQGGPTTLSRLNFMAGRVLSRPFRPEEQVILVASLINLTKDYETVPEEAKKLITTGQAKPDPALPPAELAAWTLIANQVMNLDEALNK